MLNTNRYYTALNGTTVDQSLTEYWCECLSVRQPPAQRPALLGLMNPEDCKLALEWVTIPEASAPAAARAKMLKFARDILVA